MYLSLPPLHLQILMILIMFGDVIQKNKYKIFSSFPYRFLKQSTSASYSRLVHHTGKERRKSRYVLCGKSLTAMKHLEMKKPQEGKSL